MKNQRKRRFLLPFLYNLKIVILFGLFSVCGFSSLEAQSMVSPSVVMMDEPKQGVLYKDFDLKPTLFSLPSSGQKPSFSLGKKKMAFFCDLEHKMEKKTGFPVKFRLGEVQYAERMEYGDPIWNKKEE